MQPAWVKTWVTKLTEVAAAKYLGPVLDQILGKAGAVAVLGLTAGVGARMVFEAYEHCSPLL